MTTDHFPRVTAILARIPDAATRWPGWFCLCCPLCLTECDTDSDKVAFCLDRTCDNYWQQTPLTPVMRFCPATEGDGLDVWHGDDLDPRNMHHLWAMLEALNEHGNPRIMCGGAFLFIGEEIYEGYGPTIIEAMLRCLEEAVK